MYVCLCHGITERQIHNVVAEQGVVTFEHLQAELGVATCCGQCRHCAALVLEQARALNSAARTAPEAACGDTNMPVATRQAPRLPPRWSNADNPSGRASEHT